MLGANPIIAHSFAVTSDNFTLYIALIFAVLSCLAYLSVAFSGKKNSDSPFARIAYYISFAGIACTSLYMLQCLLSGERYDIAYISDNSSIRDGFLYQLSSFWAGQAGSLLLWSLFAGLIGIVLIRRSLKPAPVLMCFWTIVQTFFLLLLVIDDPFKRLVDYQSGMIGYGLNPLLKNPWIAIHPPVIFLGYALLIVPAALAIQALIRGDARDWARKCMPWALSGWVALMAGLALGMVWSYEVLGWGGFWGWDPVENASLVPWLLATALVHGLLVQRSKNRLVHSNILLALGTFLAVMYATYLTRSGVLADASVHAFADTSAAGCLRWSMLFFLILCTGLTALRWKAISSKKEPLKLGSKEFVMTVGVIVLVLFAGMVFIGTTATTFSKNSKIDQYFYNVLSIPLAVSILTLIIASYFLNWGGKAGKHFTGLSLRRSGVHIAHTGVVLMLLGIVFSTHGSSKILNLEKNNPSTEALGYSFTYKGVKQLGEDKEIIQIQVKRAGKTFIAPLSVVHSQRGDVRSPYIRSSIFGDIYISPQGVDTRTITPVASMTDRGWVTEPVQIPGTKSSLILDGMSVESHAARLHYSAPGAKPVTLTVAAGNPAKVDGYTFSFKRFVSFDKKESSMTTAGVEIGISGREFTERAVIQVNKKPMISLLWLGVVLIIIGGTLSFLRRRSEKPYF